MAQLIIDPIKYLGRLPNFDGKTEELQGFCDMVDRIFPFLNSFDVIAQPMFIDIIKSKFIGQAKMVMDINCQAISWPEIKSILNNNFSDKRTCEELYDVMRGVSFRTNCVEFYNELREKLRQLNNKTLVVMGAGQSLNACTMNNRRSALNFFTSKVPEPMKSILVCRDPDTLKEAMDILFKAGYAYYGKDYKCFEQRSENLRNVSRVINRNQEGSSRNSDRQSNSNYNRNFETNHSRYFDRQTNNNFESRNSRMPNYDNYNRNVNDRGQNNSRSNQNDRYANNRFNNIENRSNNFQPSNNARNPPQLSEPMEIGHMSRQSTNESEVANFQLTASRETYHI